MAGTATAIPATAARPRRPGELGWLTPRHDAPGAGARLLDIDHDLARILEPAVRERLAPLLRVRIETVDAGAWTPAGLGDEPECLGLLIIDGLVLRDLSVLDRCCTELLGPGDLLRPGTGPGDRDGSIGAELQWQVVDGPVRLAVLDHRASLLIGRFPALVSELLDRTLERTKALQLQLALTQVHGIGQRLELLLWHLADRWGRVTPDGVVLPLTLTHDMLGRLIGARRPSVTTALRRLGDSGTVVRRPDGWLLREGPPTPPREATGWEPLMQKDRI